MDKVKELILRKPIIFLLVAGVYLLLVDLLKWGIHLTADTAWFIAGGVIGIYFLDAAELFFRLTPSPFRSIVFTTLFTMVSFFIVTSSRSALASGLVLSLYLQMVLWQVGEWRVAGNLNTWYRMVATPVSFKTQGVILMTFSALFFLETYLFIY